MDFLRTRSLAHIDPAHERKIAHVLEIVTCRTDKPFIANRSLAQKANRQAEFAKWFFPLVKVDLNWAARHKAVMFWQDIFLPCLKFALGGWCFKFGVALGHLLKSAT